MTVKFAPPAGPPGPGGAGVHHTAAAAGNASVVDETVAALHEALDGTAALDRILLKAAAGAGKSVALRRLVVEAVGHGSGRRVAVVAFTNKQIHPLAAALGRALGADRVCLFVAKDRWDDVPDDAPDASTVVTSLPAIPTDCAVVVATADKLGAWGTPAKLLAHLGPSEAGTAFDVLFVDEAWQLPHHKFDKLVRAAPLAVGVGDVGQLPPLEIGSNPWRGDPGFNPYRAWPTAYDGDERTWAVELPAVWRPAAGHLDLWRAFYPEWVELHCVAAPGDRSIVVNDLPGSSADIWRQVGTGVPTLLAVDGLPPSEAADVDLPLLGVVESLLDDLLAAGLALRHARYDADGSPTGDVVTLRPGNGAGDPLVAVLATRNQAVDDAADAVERLQARYGLTDAEIVASTVDSWQGQTNGITVVAHPLSGAGQLDEFNSAFGRLAVACTRATHGLLMVCRPGLDRLLGEAPARPGTPFGEPGNRHLPRQTHQRIMATFARGTLAVAPAPA